MTARTSDTTSQPAIGRLEALTAVAVVGVLALALALFCLARPGTATKERMVGYTQSGQFGYAAKALSTSVYGPEGLTSGQPILTGQVGPIKVSFAYSVASSAPTDVHGTAGLVAVVSAGQGLSRQFELAAVRPFTGGQVSMTGILPAKEIIAYANSVASTLGGQGGTGQTVTLQPTIALSGTVAGRPMQSSWAPSYAFALSGTTLSPSNNSAASVPGAPAGDPLRPSQAGSVSYRQSVTDTVPLLVARPSVTSAMLAGFVIAGLCLLLGLWLARPLLRSRRDPVAVRERIRTLYGSMIIPVREVSLPGGPVAEVASIESLAELAKRYESMIMRVPGDDGDAYLLWDNGMLYRYHDAAASAPECPREQVAPVPDTFPEWPSATLHGPRELPVGIHRANGSH